MQCGEYYGRCVCENCVKEYFIEKDGELVPKPDYKDYIIKPICIPCLKEVLENGSYSEYEQNALIKLGCDLNEFCAVCQPKK